ncbi:hypothetical protein [Zobellia russellii]|nr:hypothetical protein [Zobellia russellii]MBT9190451.1 hypothetical protein [Zobellia russellii]
MSIFLDAIRIEYESEHVLEHDLSYLDKLSNGKVKIVQCILLSFSQ